MGWLWASPSPPAEKASISAPAPSNTESTPPTSSTSSAQTAAPNEPVDPEIQKFYDLFKSDATASQESKPHKSASSSETQEPDSKPLSSWFSMRSSQEPTPAVVEAPPGDALSEALLPTDMSCRQAFDLAWACNSMGGQWNAVYRYGEMRSCSDHWNDFWFCMRARGYSGEMREERIRAHYRNKEYAKYGSGKPSSEDVWQSRDEKVPVGTAFTEPID